ncbi:MAG: NUDIX domain-containing protein [Caulobacter sp.]|nr:NUDIX domain-containing protein [Caulobacter sp.]
MGLLIDDEGRVQLGLRASWKAVHPGRWDAIDGRLEGDETAEAALVREVQEELGVTCWRPNSENPRTARATSRQSSSSPSGSAHSARVPTSMRPSPGSRSRRCVR